MAKAGGEQSRAVRMSAAQPISHTQARPIDDRPPPAHICAERRGAIPRDGPPPRRRVHEAAQIALLLAAVASLTARM